MDFFDIFKLTDIKNPNEKTKKFHFKIYLFIE